MISDSVSYEKRGSELWNRKHFLRHLSFATGHESDAHNHAKIIKYLILSLYIFLCLTLFLLLKAARNSYCHKQEMTSFLQAAPCKLLVKHDVALNISPSGWITERDEQ